MTVDMFTQLEATIEHKTLSSSLIAILIKGIFANFFINISLVIAMQIDDILAKMFVMMFGVSILHLWVMNMSYTILSFSQAVSFIIVTY